LCVQATLHRQHQKSGQQNKDASFLHYEIPSVASTLPYAIFGRHPFDFSITQPGRTLHCNVWGGPS
jgi:hypothetical protein